MLRDAKPCTGTTYEPLSKPVPATVPRPLHKRSSPNPYRVLPVGIQTWPATAIAECYRDLWAQTANHASVEEVVTKARHAINYAAVLLRKRVRVPATGRDSDPAAAHALVWLHALLIQELLAVRLDPGTLAPAHRHKKIPAPDPMGRPSVIHEQWGELLRINWWPIFSVARETLGQTSSEWTELALPPLRDAAKSIAESGIVRRHDVAGRISRRLLDSRKFLATNYTPMPAAMLLAGLAMDPHHELWRDFAWSSPERIASLRIVDPACGSGTLLMAVVQEVLKRYRRAGGDEETRSAIVKELLENALHGFDVVPAAVHLTAATLSMADTRQAIAEMPVYWMPHDVHEGTPRLGSLDFLTSSASGGKAQYMQIFPDQEAGSRRVTGSGRDVQVASMPEQCDLFIANPPHTRAGGPGSAENTVWNPLYGSALSSADAKQVQEALRKTLATTPASLHAGLGSAFAVLAHERLKEGGRLAMVLPATALTGGSWARIRAMLLEHYRIDWVVASHDSRNRDKTKHLPGRRFVGFSEPTRIAETLIVATKATQSDVRDGFVRFVNLRINPQEPIEAIALVHALLAMLPPKAGSGSRELALGKRAWGDVCFARQSELSAEPWPHVSLVQAPIVNLALTLRDRGILRLNGISKEIPVGLMGDLCNLGPYEMQIKNPKQGLFRIVETDDSTRSGHPALWQHKSDRIVSLRTAVNARLRQRDDRDTEKQSAMMQFQGRLQIARELRHVPQRLAAVLTSERALGVRSWSTLLPKRPAPGKDEALCLWLNSTPGLILRVVYGNRPCLGRSSVHHQLLRTLPALDVDRLSVAQLSAARQLFEDLSGKELSGFAHIAIDPVRRELDHRLFKEVLGHDLSVELDELASALNDEPTLTVRR